MRGQDLTPETIFTNTQYRMIMSLITFAQHNKKRIKFEHLRYALVKDAAARMSENARKESEEVFEYKRSILRVPMETPYDLNKGYQNAFKSELEYLRYVEKYTDTMKLSSENNLNYHINRLKEKGLIKTIPKKKRYPAQRVFYLPTFEGAWCFELASLQLQTHSFVDNWSNAAKSERNLSELRKNNSKLIEFMKWMRPIPANRWKKTK